MITETEEEYLAKRTNVIAIQGTAKTCCGVQGNLGFEKGSKWGDDSTILVCKECRVHHYVMKAQPIPVTRAQTAVYPAPSSVPFNPCFVADVGM